MLDSVGAGALDERPRTATRAATRSETSRVPCAARADAPRARPGRCRGYRRRWRPGAAARGYRTHGRSVAGQGLGDRALGNDGHRARSRRFRCFRMAFPRTAHRRVRSSASDAARSATTQRRGRQIIDELGAEHMRTGTADRLHVGRQRVSDCRSRGCHSRSKSNIGSTRSRSNSPFRVMASAASSPGRSSAQPGRFTRTSNRRDFAMPPTAETVLDRLVSCRTSPHRHRQGRRSVCRARHHARAAHRER